MSCGSSINPSLTGFPVVVNCPGGVLTFADVRRNNSVTNCPPKGPCGVIERTWSLLGCPANPNLISCVQLITVAELSAPIIVCPADVSIACGSATSPYQTGFPTGSSVCGPVEFRITAQPQSPLVCNQVIEREWSAISVCNRTSSCVQRIRVGQHVFPPVDPTVPPVCQCGKPSPWCPTPECASTPKPPSAGEPEQSLEFLFEGMFNGFNGKYVSPVKRVCYDTPFGQYCE